MMDFDSIKKFCLTHKRMSLASNENTSIRDRVLLNEHILRKKVLQKVVSDHIMEANYRK